MLEERNYLVSPAAHAEQELIRAILDGEYPPGTSLPNERSLSRELGITRPTLREALKRMERDGWIRIRHGKATLVNDFWVDGGLNVLSSMTMFRDSLPPDFVDHLLESRIAIAPHYAELAVQRNGREVAEFASKHSVIALDSREISRFDWQLHHRLATLSGNPIYTFIINGFRRLYMHLATGYFQQHEARRISLQFYRELERIAREGQAQRAKELTLEVMRRSRELWRSLQQGGRDP